MHEQMDGLASHIHSPLTLRMLPAWSIINALRCILCYVNDRAVIWVCCGKSAHPVDWLRQTHQTKLTQGLIGKRAFQLDRNALI